jgi:hypothetical protein
MFKSNFRFKLRLATVYMALLLLVLPAMTTYTHYSNPPNTNNPTVVEDLFDHSLDSVFDSRSTFMDSMYNYQIDPSSSDHLNLNNSRVFEDLFAGNLESIPDTLRTLLDSVYDFHVADNYVTECGLFVTSIIFFRDSVEKYTYFSGEMLSTSNIPPIHGYVYGAPCCCGARTLRVKTDVLGPFNHCQFRCYVHYHVFVYGCTGPSCLHQYGGAGIDIIGPSHSWQTGAVTVTSTPDSAFCGGLRVERRAYRHCTSNCGIPKQLSVHSISAQHQFFCWRTNQPLSHCANCGIPSPISCPV